MPAKTELLCRENHVQQNSISLLRYYFFAIFSIWFIADLGVLVLIII